MSRTARSVPRTVPVTFERPRRGSSVTGTSSIRQPGALEGAGARRAHRDAAERLGIGAAEPDPPVAAVEGGPEYRVGALDRGEAGVEQLRRHLRRVHPNQEGGPRGGLECIGQARRQPVTALRHDFDVVRKPCPGCAVEHEHAPGGAARARCGRQRVAQRGAGELCRLSGGTRRRQARLDPPRDRALRDDEQGGAHTGDARQGANWITAGRQTCLGRRAACRAPSP